MSGHSAGSGNCFIILYVIVSLFLISLLSCHKELVLPFPQPQPNISTSAYLDIETTGLKISTSDIIIVGIYRETVTNSEVTGTFITLANDGINAERLKEIFQGVNILYTYNGTRFDPPFIKKKPGLDLNEYCHHIDLMNICHKKNLYGGLKEVEKVFGIYRESDVTGSYVPELWRQYKDEGDKDALLTLIKYNKDNVVNLVALKQELDKYDK